jgi:hypothetical protein
MTRFELRRFNGQWENRGVIRRIRRKIEARVRMGECVLLDGEGVVGLSEASLNTILDSLPEDKVRVVGISSLQPFPILPEPVS